MWGKTNGLGVLKPSKSLKFFNAIKESAVGLCCIIGGIIMLKIFNTKFSSGVAAGMENFVILQR